MKLHYRLADFIINTLRWSDFTDIQKTAIPAVLKGKNSLIIARTGSGKTEAAMIPVFDRLLRAGGVGDTGSVDREKRRGGVFCVYVAPLRTLLNDMTGRVAKWCEKFSFNYTLWHSDAAGSKKAAFLKAPTEFLLITPESLESFIINRSESEKSLCFAGADFMIIDEAHSFYSTGRGFQLGSLIKRLEAYAGRSLQKIALSATVENAEKVAGWLFSGEDYEVSDEKESKKLEISLKYDKVDGGPGRLVECLKKNRGAKVIVFTRSRGACESLADEARKSGLRGDLFVHHSAVEKDIREDIETRFKASGAGVLINAASFELGIDIGDVDFVMNAGALDSPSRARQRAGRAGRRGPVSRLINFVSGDFELLMSLAVINMMNAGRLERKHCVEKPYDIYLHQILSKVMQRGSARPGVIFGELAAVESYRAITAAEFDGILESLVIHDLIKKENGMITLSRGFEKRFSGMNFISFYSVFESEKQFSVLENTTRVGSLDSHFVMNGLNAGDKFMLGGRKYVAMDIDLKKGVIQARRVDSGRAPRWRSEPVACEYDVIAEMHRVLGSCGGRGASGGEIEKLRAVMDSCANERFDELVRAASASGIDGGGIYLWPDEALNEVKILTFGSAYVNNVIRALLTAAFPGTKVTSSCPASLSVAPPPLLQTRAFAARLGEFIEKIPDIMRSKPEILMKSAAASGMIKPVRGKFAAYLPADLHDRLFMMKYFEPETACAHIRKHSVTSLSRPDILNEINL